MSEEDKDAGVEIEAEGTEQPGVEAEGSKAPEDQKVDYKAELVKVRQERDNYKRALTQKKEFVRKGATTTEEEHREEVDPSDEVADKVIQKLAPMFSRNVVEEELARLSDNPDKRDLIREHYEFSIVKTGLDPASVRADLRKALAIADSSRIIRERDEAARAATTTRSGTSLAGSNTGKDKDVKSRTHGWTDEQITAMNNRHKAAVGKPMTDAQLKAAWDNYQRRKAQAA